jgi:hypothetical protein
VPEPYKPSRLVTVLYFLCSPFTAASVASFAGNDLKLLPLLFLLSLAALWSGYGWVRQNDMRTTLAMLVVMGMAVPTFITLSELLPELLS